MKDKTFQLEDYLDEVLIDRAADPNSTLQDEITTRNFKWLPVYLQSAPHLLNPITCKMLSEFLFAHSKKKRGRKSNFTNSQIWDMCAEYDDYLSRGIRNRRSLAKICQRHNVQEAHLKQLYLREKNKRAQLQSALNEAHEALQSDPTTANSLWEIKDLRR